MIIDLINVVKGTDFSQPDNFKNLFDKSPARSMLQTLVSLNLLWSWVSGFCGQMATNSTLCDLEGLRVAQAALSLAQSEKRKMVLLSGGGRDKLSDVEREEVEECDEFIRQFEGSGQDLAVKEAVEVVRTHPKERLGMLWPLMVSADGAWGGSAGSWRGRLWRGITPTWSET